MTISELKALIDKYENLVKGYPDAQVMVHDRLKESEPGVYEVLSKVNTLNFRGVIPLAKHDRRYKTTNLGPGTRAEPAFIIE